MKCNIRRILPRRSLVQQVTQQSCYSNVTEPKEKKLSSSEKKRQELNQFMNLHQNLINTWSGQKVETPYFR